MFKFLSRSKSASDNDDETAAPRSLPSIWYRDPAMFELERRAVFSRRWLLITHRSRFQKAGDYAGYEVAGFPFFLCLDRDENLNGFHNVCRHRAYPVVTKPEGNASVLACKYHGWSYGLKGNLAKAPRFDTMPNFDKAGNGLFKVHTHIDARGFVWVNLAAGDQPPVAWSSDFQGADVQPRLDAFNMEEFTYDHSWEMKGEYNWKTLIDNYNEASQTSMVISMRLTIRPQCYHCSVAHPGIAATSDLSSYDVHTVGGQIQHFAKDKPGKDSGLNVAPTFLFPNASVTMTTKYFYLMRVVPQTSTTTLMQYEVYRHSSASEEEFQEVDAFFKQVEAEDKGLCDAAQKNLNSGTYIAGDLHSFNEKGVLFFQKHLKEIVTSHRSQEREAGAEIWPTRQSPSRDGLDEEIRFCEGLSCGSNEKEIEW